MVVVGLRSMVSLRFLGDLEHVGASLGLNGNGGNHRSCLFYWSSEYRGFILHS